VLGVIHSTVEQVDRALQADLLPLVIGGDCTITLGVVGAFVSARSDPGLAYIDGSPDLNTPDDSPTGILDSMGAAHLLGLGDPRLARVGPTYPMLAEDRIAFFGYTPEVMNPAEAERLSQHVARGGLACSASAARPSVGASARAMSAALAARAGAVVVHLDVDVIEAVDFPGGNVPQFNTGLTFAEACQALDAFVDEPKLGAIVITEFNPDRDRAGELADRLVRAIVDSLRQG
jgi:arginase